MENLLPIAKISPLDADGAIHVLTFNTASFSGMTEERVAIFLDRLFDFAKDKKPNQKRTLIADFTNVKEISSKILAPLAHVSNRLSMQGEEKIMIVGATPEVQKSFIRPYPQCFQYYPNHNMKQAIEIASGRTPF